METIPLGIFCLLVPVAFVVGILAGTFFTALAIAMKEEEDA